MKILLISDTHGKNIDWISAYAEKVKADVCIHAGDFGFYDTNSVEAFSQRELFLQVKHSDIESAEKTHLLAQLLHHHGCPKWQISEIGNAFYL